MKIAIYDTHRFERSYLQAANRAQHELVFHEFRLNEATLGTLADADIVCAFVNDQLNDAVLEAMSSQKIGFIALRCAGFNQVDLKAAERFGIRVARVPEYSPYAVAEHATALLLSLNRKIHRAYGRVREGNFSLDGLVGFDLHGKTVGIVGLGRIGQAFARIMRGFGCRLIGHDKDPQSDIIQELGIELTSFDSLLESSDVVSLHVPLTPETRHLVDRAAFARMKPGAMIINTGRGALIHARDLIGALKSGHIGGAGLDVYEEEDKCFFQDLSDQVIQDDTLMRLLTFPNVLITSHQGFLTHEALEQIATVTFANIDEFSGGQPLSNEVKVASVLA